MGSDGLFDNVFDHEIVSVISKIQNAVEAGTFPIFPLPPGTCLLAN